MVEKQRLYERITDEYGEKLLNWAVKKTGTRADGEDLAQEVFLQVFLAIKRQDSIEKPEHFVWKVARYVWYSRLRQLKIRNTTELSDVLPDGTDFTHDLAQSEALGTELACMRRSLADLNRLQREMMILHYLEGLSVCEVAARLGATESAVTWHLFDARKQVREEMVTMNDEKATLYHPGSLSISCSGESPAYPDTEKVRDSLIRQNLCLLCRSKGKTIDELTEAIGIPKPFLEYDLDWLVEHEFLTLNSRRYCTAFLILDQKYFQNRTEIYTASKKSYIDVIISYLWEQEAQIRKVGFYGSDFPAEKLYWAVIMMFTSYCSRNSELLLKLKNRDRCKIRPDGGKYYVMASDRSDGANEGFSHLNPTGWNDFYGICSDSCEAGGKHESYYWLGVYNFSAQEYHPEIVSASAETRAVIHKVYCNATEAGFSPEALSPEEKEKLAMAVEDGLIIKAGNTYKPSFIIFTPEQLSMLQRDVFQPLLNTISPQMIVLSDKFFKMHKMDFASAADDNVEHHVYIDLWVSVLYTYMFAAESGKLILPQTPKQGVPLTLVIIAQEA